MLNTDSSFSINKSSVIYMLICSCGIILFVFFGVIPNQKKLAALDSDIISMEQQIKEQKILSPLLQDLLGKIQFKEVAGLSCEKKKGIEKSQFNTIEPVFQNILYKNRLNLISFTQDINLMSKSIKNFFIKLSFTGHLNNIRHALLQIQNISFVEKVTKIQINSAQHNKLVELKLLIIMN